MREITADLDRWQHEGEQIALATLVGMRGSAPRLPGARLCLTRSGKMAGSISGGCIESDLFERAVQVLDDGLPALTSYGIADEVGFEVGLDTVGPEPHVVEAGGVRQRAWVQRISPGPGPAEVECEFRVSDPDFEPGWNPYFVKVTQEDGEMAWSSPIFVRRPG